MSNIRKRKQSEKYAVLPNSVLQDETVSFRARGLLAYLLSLPDDFLIKKTELHHKTNSANPKRKEGRDAVIASFDELIEVGYITVEITKFRGLNQYDYLVDSVKNPTVTAQPLPLKRNGSPVTDEPEPIIPIKVNKESTSSKDEFDADKDEFDADKAEFEFAKKKIHNTYLQLKKADILQNDLCINLHISPEYYQHLLFAFVMEQTGLAQAGTTVIYNKLPEYWKNWVRVQSELGPKSVHHPDYKKVLDLKNPLPVVESAKPQAEESTEEQRKARMNKREQERIDADEKLKKQRPELFDDNGKRLPASEVPKRLAELQAR